MVGILHNCVNVGKDKEESCRRRLLTVKPEQLQETFLKEKIRMRKYALLNV